jgi:hypothetical protein
MLDLQNVLSMWEKDSIIDEMNLDEASRDAAKLHAKYLQLYSMAKLQKKKEELAQKVLLKDKFLYYAGKLSQEEIDSFGWDYDPFKGLKIMKGDMDRFYDADVDIQKSESKIEYWKVLVDTLKDIIDSIKWRSNSIKNIIDWRKFSAGS